MGEGCNDTRTQTRMIQMALHFSGGEAHDYNMECLLMLTDTDYAIYAYDAKREIRFASQMPRTHNDGNAETLNANRTDRLQRNTIQIC